MISINIKRFRKSREISQEEIAVKLGIVRQTVSKWENGLSVPDADVLIHMAKLLGVPVSQLLGIETENNSVMDLSEELAKRNEELAKKKQHEKLLQRAGKKRGLILTLSIAAMMIALIIQNEAVSILLSGLCLFAAALTLYRNLALLTSITTKDLKIRILRITTFLISAFSQQGLFLLSCFLATLSRFRKIAKKYLPWLWYPV